MGLIGLPQRLLRFILTLVSFKTRVGFCLLWKSADIVTLLTGLINH